LCLIKYYTMKTWASGGIAPHILNLSIRWKTVVSYMPWPLYTQGKSPPVPAG